MIAAIIIYALVNLASALGSGGILVTVLLGLFFRLDGTRAATGALVSGALINVLTNTILNLDAPFLLSIAVSAAAYLLIALLDRRAGQRLIA